MKHHPRCLFWIDNENDACDCSLSAPRPPHSALAPVSEAAWREWVAGVNEGMERKMTDERDAAILAIIEDAISEGAWEWDAYAMPATKEPAARALARIREVLSDAPTLPRARGRNRPANAPPAASGGFRHYDTGRGRGAAVGPGKPG